MTDPKRVRHPDISYNRIPSDNGMSIVTLSGKTICTVHSWKNESYNGPGFSKHISVVLDGNARPDDLASVIASLITAAAYADAGIHHALRLDVND